MNIFNKLAQKETKSVTTFGSADGKVAQRINFWFNVLGGKGFKQEPKGPKLSRGGKTRKERIKNGELPYKFRKVGRP